MKNKYKILKYISFSCVLFIIIINSNNIQNNKNETKMTNKNALGIFIQNGENYYESNNIPENGYKLNSEKSYCKKGEITLDTTITYDTNTKSLSITPITEKGTKCYLYFDEFNPYSARDKILTNMTTITTRSSFSTTYTSSTTGTIFTAEDDDGTSYYFAGAPRDNWVKFGGFYWRIVRINGDGTIRIIYNGTSTETTVEETNIIKGLRYNTFSDNNMYVGYMYTSGQIHGYETSSNIKNELDNWYDSNLTSYANKIDANAGFCNDRTPQSGTGTGTTATTYAAYTRLHKERPSLKCSDANDLFTPSGSSKGNKKLSKPIGLITADEVAYAGGSINSNNTSYYLYNSQNYWTMTPAFGSGEDIMGYSTVDVMYVYFLGGIYNDNADYTEPGVRPVINLRSDINFKEGTLGTSTNPYIVE